MNPLVSIIVPIYNVEQYLDRCINSIVSQTYRNIEIILVDDGSPDNCPQMCDDWAKKDNRILVVHKVNGGLSDARNAALDIASGEYFFFLDSDDMIAINAIEVLVSVLIRESSDMVISKNYIVFSGEIENVEAELNSIVTLDSDSALENILCKTMRWEAWGTLYKRDIFDNLRYPVGRIYEDLPVTPKAVMLSKKVSLVDAEIYYYFIRNDSIMRNSNTVVKIDLYYSACEIIDYLGSVKDITVRSNSISGIIQELASRIHLAGKDKKNNIDFIRLSKKLIFKNFKYMLLSNKVSIKQKVFICCVLVGVSNIIWR